MFRIVIAMIIGGGILAFMGGRDLALSSQCSSDPVLHDLSDLEQGGEIDNPHIKFGEHVAAYGGMIYEYEQKEGQGNAVHNGTKLTKAYYGIVSLDHPFIQEYNKLAERENNGEEIADSEFPDFKNFTVLVKTKRYKTLGQMPEDMLALEDGISGVVINQIESLDTEEKYLIRNSFPEVDIDKILILEEGRTPNTLINIAMLGGGIVLIIAGAGILIFRSASSN